MKKILIGALLISASSFTLADTNKSQGWYVGGGVGSSEVDLDPRFDSEFESTNTSTGTLIVYGGYNFLSWFALEADYSYAGEFKDANSSEDVYLVGTSLMPKFSVKLNNNVSLYGKVGAQFYSYDFKDSSIRDSEFVGLETAAAVGTEFKFSNGLGVRLEYKYAEMELENDDDYFDSDYFDFWDDEIDLQLHQFTGSVSYSF